MERSIMVAIVALLLSNVGASVDARLTGDYFERTIGYLLIGESFQTFTNTRLSYCLIACQSVRECKYLNALREDLVGGTQCQLFNTSTIVNTATLIPSENSTFYKSINFKDCLDAKMVHNTGKSGIFPILLPFTTPNEAFCDMETDGGGWTLLQRRIDGSVDFDVDWQSYKVGFGNLESDFWLGLDAAHFLMRDGNVTLRFDLWDGPTYYFIEYYGATISSESDNYRLNWDSYQGNTSDSLSFHKNMEFTTKDHDNDVYNLANCAVDKSGGWWYKNCLRVNLNGDYGSTRIARGVNWNSIDSLRRSLSKTEMKVKLNG